MTLRNRIAWLRGMAAEARAREVPRTGSLVPIKSLVAGFWDGIADKLETRADREEGHPERPKIRRRLGKFAAAGGGE